MGGSDTNALALTSASSASVHSGHRFEPLAKDSVRFRFGQIWENRFKAFLGICWLVISLIVGLNWFINTLEL